MDWDGKVVATERQFVIETQNIGLQARYIDALSRATTYEWYIADEVA